MKTKRERLLILNENTAASILAMLREHREAIAALQERLASQQDYIERLENYALYFMQELLALYTERLRGTGCNGGDTKCNGGDTGGKCGGGRRKEGV